MRAYYMLDAYLTNIDFQSSQNDYKVDIMIIPFYRWETEVKKS